MPDTRPASPRMAFAGVVLFVLGLGIWGLYRVTAGSEAHSYTPGAVAPTSVHLTAGKTYTIAVPGGVHTALAAGLEPTTLRCSITGGADAETKLEITPESQDTKATNQIASFVAPLSGRAHVDCPGLPSVFVDDADDASADVSGVWLILASLALAIGIPLILSVLRRPRSDDAALAIDVSADRTREHDEVE